MQKGTNEPWPNTAAFKSCIEERRFLCGFADERTIGRHLFELGPVEVVDTGGIPKDASFVGCRYSAEHQGLLFCFAHPDFDPVPPGQIVPMAEPATIRFREKGGES